MVVPEKKSGPANHWRQIHTGICRYGPNRAVIFANVTVLAITLVSNLCLSCFLIHSKDVTRTTLNTGLAADTLIGIDFLYSHDVTPYIVSKYERSLRQF
jgi:hypothetical protein